MKTYKVLTTRILYSINWEDLDYCETEQDFIEECAKVIGELPQGLELEITCNKCNLDDMVCDAVSDETGWLVDLVEYKII